MSTRSSASPLALPRGSISFRTPVEVSAWTTAITAGEGCAVRSWAGSSGSPHSASTRTTSAPWRHATSHIRSPKTPFTPTTTGSPGRTKLTNEASIPAEPVPLMGSVSELMVTKTLRSRSLVLSSSSRNWGSRWPKTGPASAMATSGYGFEGPGPISRRSEIRTAESWQVRTHLRQRVRAPQKDSGSVAACNGCSSPPGRCRHPARTWLRTRAHTTPGFERERSPGARV